MHPYPSQYVSVYPAKDGHLLTIRPIRSEDEPLLVHFHEQLSTESVYLRYLQVLKLSVRIAHDRLARRCAIDYDQEMALVAEQNDPQTGATEIVAVARFIKKPGKQEAEVALLVADHFQGVGLGTRLLQQLVEIARQEKLCRLTATIHPENCAMQHLCAKVRFSLQCAELRGLVRAVLELQAPVLPESPALLPACRNPIAA